MRRIIVYVSIFLIVSMAICATVYSLRAKRMGEYLNVDTELSENNFKAVTSTYKKIFTSVYEGKINIGDVKFYMAAGYKSKAGRDSYRELLRQLVMSAFKILHSFNVKNMQFYFPDSTVFLRMNQSDKYGDAASPSRVTVPLANEKDIAAEGFEKGQFYTGYRYVYPLDNNNKHVGAVEFVVGIDGLINTMNELYGDCYKYVITSNGYSKYSGLPVEKLADGIFVDTCKSCFEESNHDESFVADKILTRDLKQKLKGRFYKFEKFSYITEYHNKPYVFTFIPIKFTDGSGVGYIISYHQDPVIDKINLYYYMMAGVCILALAFLIAGYAILDIRRRETSIINANLEKLVNAKIQEIRDRDTFFAQQGKMVALGEMLTSILHQWKQPISSISMMADMVEFDCAQENCKNTESLKLIAEIKHQTKFMNQTVKDFMAFLKPSDEPVIFNVCDAVDELIKLFDFSFARHNTSFKINWGEEERLKANIYGFPNEFKHVMLNLFNNSRDAISETRDRMIADNVDVSQYKGEIGIDVRVENNKIRVIVADTGGGIPEAVIGLIFDQHFSTKQERGTGIGLYMTKNLVEQNMKGSVTVLNNNKGAEFTLEFPAA